VAVAGTFVLLLPATAAMGATLPAMERVTARLRRDGGSIAALYAANTLGAVLGVLACAFWLVPAWGLSRTAAVCAALNLLWAAACLLGTASLWGAERFKDAVLQALGGGMAPALLAEAALAVLAFLPATVAMGALFSHLGTQAQATGIGFARALGANTLGAAAA